MQKQLQWKFLIHSHHQSNIYDSYLLCLKI